jgi:hypothetical protein
LRCNGSGLANLGGQRLATALAPLPALLTAAGNTDHNHPDPMPETLDLYALIHHALKETETGLLTAIGVLEMVKADLIAVLQAHDETEEGEGDA